jgi:hypothetical protein
MAGYIFKKCLKPMMATMDNNIRKMKFPIPKQARFVMIIAFPVPHHPEGYAQRFTADSEFLQTISSTLSTLSTQVERSYGRIHAGNDNPASGTKKQAQNTVYMLWLASVVNGFDMVWL